MLRFLGTVVPPSRVTAVKWSAGGVPPPQPAHIISRSVLHIKGNPSFPATFTPSSNQLPRPPPPPQPVRRRDQDLRHPLDRDAQPLGDRVGADVRLAVQAVPHPDHDRLALRQFPQEFLDG